MQRLRQIGTRRQDGAIFCDQRYAQMLGDSNEFTVVGTAATAAHKLQHMLGADLFFVGREDRRR